VVRVPLLSQDRGRAVVGRVREGQQVLLKRTPRSPASWSRVVSWGASMANKKIIWIGMTVGSTIGGFIPSLWHAGMFSMWSIVLSTIGGIAGIWAGYQIGR
jgi:hypothetical protein